MEDEINVAKYVEVLLQRWWLLLAGTILGCILVAGYSWLQPKTYRASATVATVKSSTQVSFDSAITTLSEEQLRSVDRKQRQAALVNLVKSTGIADKVIARLSTDLPSNLTNASALLHIIQGELLAGSDLIIVSATHADPQVAGIVANAWAETYVSEVNRLYGGSGGESYQAVVTELAAAQETYQQEQQALQALYQENRTEAIQRQIDEHRALIASLSQARQGALERTISEAQRIDALLANAESLQHQIQIGGEAAVSTSATALMLLKIEAFGRATDLPSHEPLSTTVSVRPSDLIISTAIETPTTTHQDLLQDARALVDALVERRQALDDELLQIAEALGQGDDWSFVETLGTQSTSRPVDTQLSASLEQLEAAVRDLNAQLAEEQSRLEQATMRRKLAWDALQALALKERELAISLETTGAEVRLASPALAPRNPTVSLPKRAAIGAVIGLLASMAGALVIEFVRSRPSLNKPQSH